LKLALQAREKKSLQERATDLSGGRNTSHRVLRVNKKPKRNRKRIDQQGQLCLRGQKV